MTNPNAWKPGARLAELDGLRGLAVVAVILFHCEVAGVLDAGFFGVDMFFAISGFIITAMLMEEYRNHGDFDFPNFYFRRLKRLLPPMLGLIAIAFLGTAVLSAEALRKFVADAPAALVYLSNWWQIADKQDYFDTTPHVLKHLWSLAVEEQFYIVWPPIAYRVLRRRGPRAVGMLALAASVASTAWMWHVYLHDQDATDQNRIYLGADTHAMGLLAGAALGSLWNPWAPRATAWWARLFPRLAALAALVLLAAMATRMNAADPWLYRGAFLAVPLLTCVAAWGLLGDQGFFVARLLRASVPQWLGLRSYSLYLVHWPVFVWMGLLGYGDMTRWPVLAAALAIVGVLAELMYRCVELPSKRFDLTQAGTRPKVAVIAGYAIIATSFSVAITLAEVKPQGEAPLEASGAARDTRAAVPLRVAARPARHAGDDLRDPPDANVRIAGGDALHALGDSVLLGAQDHLEKTIPGIDVDAAVGRQASHGLKVVQAWQDKLDASSVVLVHLGTNGYINEAQYRELLAGLAVCKAVLLVNVHADRRWTAPNNEIIARMAHDFPNAQLVDWSRASAERPDYFVKDGIHLTRRGILAYASVIKQATGGAPLPEPAPAPKRAAAPAGAKPHRVAHKAVPDGAGKGKARPDADVTAEPAPESAPEPAAPAPAPDAPAAPAHDPSPAAGGDASTP